MTVSSFDPSEIGDPDITMTDGAIGHVRAQLATTGASGIRLAIKESGCNGYMYTLDYLDSADEDDEAVAVADDLTLYLRRADIPMLRGTVIDLVVEGLNRSLRFLNPNADGHCGCGESFSIAS